jgi:hypothetical protein
MTRLYELLASFAVGIASAGCASVEVHVARLRATEAPRVTDVPFLTSVPVDVYDVAILQATAVDDELPRALAALKRTARELGCDAVVRMRVETTGARAHVTGLCVRYAEQATSRDVPAEAPAAPPLTL